MNNADIHCADLGKPLFTVPFERDENFIDRKAIFDQIERKLHKHYHASLCGLGGVGCAVSFQGSLIHANGDISENRRSPSSTLTGFASLDRIVMSSGCSQPALVHSCRPVKKLHGA